MLSLTVRIGQAVQLGEYAVIKVEEKSGRNVRLVFATAIQGIHLLADGIIPKRFTVGITGERKVVDMPRPAQDDRLQAAAG
ncbi:hypothetical protein LJR231_001575 [Phyllobacterium sp. LjRoot231]|uniref:hypothetical protein n=1 Tax=Phyllobacterium sp. LjRoot231 TaxID=3342289 RepID=UPI003ECDA6E2